MIKIYTDGSANKKGCGCAYVVTDEEDNIIYYDCIYTDESTNNREEMKAIICAYNYIIGQCYIEHTHNQEDFVIYSDSAYCVNMINQWIDNWEAAGWRKYDGGTILNQDLVMSLHSLKHRLPNVKVEKTIGHAGIKGNEMADALAQGKMDKFFKYINNPALNELKKLTK